MTNFIFKSANRLIKNSPFTPEDLIRRFDQVQTEQRYARSDLQMISRKLDRLLVDKHLQLQVDDYFQNEGSPTHPEDRQDID